MEHIQRLNIFGSLLDVRLKLGDLRFLGSLGEESLDRALAEFASQNILHLGSFGLLLVLSLFNSSLNLVSALNSIQESSDFSVLLLDPEVYELNGVGVVSLLQLGNRIMKLEVGSIINDVLGVILAIVLHKNVVLILGEEQVVKDVERVVEVLLGIHAALRQLLEVLKEASHLAQESLEATDLGDSVRVELFTRKMGKDLAVFANNFFIVDLEVRGHDLVEFTRLLQESLILLRVLEEFDLTHLLTEFVQELSSFLNESLLHITHRLLGGKGRNENTRPSLQKNISHLGELTVSSNNLERTIRILASNSISDVIDELVGLDLRVANFNRDKFSSLNGVNHFIDSKIEGWGKKMLVYG
mmetsp:Transcript_104958/g.146344  ORF Transcript_104958/g.146344 Transcript_104958/m.146344 type:complete len:357 (-) Transcript_104958:54-1124(-)